MFGHYCVFLFVLNMLFNKFSDAHPLIGKNVQPAKKSEFPFIVSLSNACDCAKKKHLCGGSLISEKHVLTSAHCIVNKHICCVKVIVGTTDFESGQIYEIEEWITYDDWSIENNITREYVDNDIAIITLSQNVKDVKLGVISKLKRSDVIKKRRVVTAGWGFIDQSKRLKPKSLQKAHLNVLTREECEQNEAILFNPVLIPMPLNKYFTSANPPVVATRGDSGGPLILERKKEIVGVNDSGYIIDKPENNPNAYSVHIAVDCYRDFIDSVIQSNKSQKNMCSIS